MGGLVLAGNTSGSTTLQATDAVTATITLPSATTTLVGKTTPSFTTTIGVGNATPSASGAGITFPATQSASTDANTLDDYEEGTWTPNIGGNDQGSSGGAGNVYSVRVGTYVKVGKIVTCTLNVGLSTSSGNSGVVIFINGWPFVPDATANAGLYTSVAWGGLGANFTNVMGYFNANQANLHLIGITTGATTINSFINTSQLTNTSAFSCTFTYITT